MRGVMGGSMIQPDIPPLPSARAFASRHPALVAVIALFVVTFAAVRIVAALPEERTPPIRIGRWEPWPAEHADLENRLRAKNVQFVLLPPKALDEALLLGQIDVVLPLASDHLTYDAGDRRSRWDRLPDQ